MSAALALVLAADSASATPPPYTATILTKSGDTVTGVGPVANALTFMNPSLGVRGGWVTNSGQWMLYLDTTHNPTSTAHEVFVKTQAPRGPFAPYLTQGTSGPLTAPAAGAAVTTFFAQTMNNAGDAAFAFGWAPDDFDLIQQGTAIVFNTGTTVLSGGDPATATGFAPGTVWNDFDSSTTLVLNDNNQLLVSSTVTESGMSRRAIVRLQLDGSGNPTSRTLIAKEGGVVAGGSGTWTTIWPGSAGTTTAMNNSGAVVFTGTTSTGVEGVYSSAGGGGGGGFVAQVGGTAPVPGETWGALAGTPLDINNAGTVAFSGQTSSSTGSYAESSPDAGETMDFEDHTFGNGPLNLITGTLSNDQDVDWFRVVVTDPNTFSATTVPDAGSGFAGASFDTVLTLIADPGESGAGSTPGGRTQCDNVSSTVMQSTITGGGGRTRAGGSYFLGISTPKSRAEKVTSFISTNQMVRLDAWSADPAGLAVGGGLVYWGDRSAGALRSATTGGVVQSDVAMTGITGVMALDAAGGKVYWADNSAGTISRMNLNGSGVETLSTTSTSVNDAIPGGALVSGMALDLPNGKVYWTRAWLGEVNRSNLDGTGAERVLQDELLYNHHIPGPTTTGTLAPQAIAIDTSAPSANRIYWVNSHTDRIERCNLDGTGRTTLAVGAGAGFYGGLAIDSTSGNLYWANTSGGKIQRSNLDGSSPEDVCITAAPQALKLDVAGGFVYWTSTVDRVVRRASITGGFPAVAAVVVSAGVDVGERSPDGPAVGYSGYINAWNRFGTAGSTALPYQIKLTGATFQYSKRALAKVTAAGVTSKVMAVGDAVPTVASSFLSTLAPSGSAIRISDRGDVLWSGAYYPVTGQNHPPTGVFYNGELLFNESTVIASDPKMAYQLGGQSTEMSSDGTYAVIGMNMNYSPYVFNQYDTSVLFQFTLPALNGACCNGASCSVVAQASCTGSYKGDGTACDFPGNPVTCCKANYNHMNGLEVQDIFDFLNGWFAGNPAADFNGGGLSVQDIFDFLNAWFAGCS
jgi:hypothetical protein